MPHIRLVTYNIHGCVGRDGRLAVERVAGVLAELGADVIALQELRSTKEPLGALDFLAERTGLHAVAGPTMVKVDSTYGNALLLRFRPLEIRRIDLSVPGREPRGALDVDLDAEGVSLRVMATHLGLRPAERRLQVRRLLTQIDAGSRAPRVLMGDLNEWFLWGRPLRWLHAIFRGTPAIPTYPSGRPVFALDRIWVQPRRMLRSLTTHSSPLARVASDHLPLVATIDLGLVAAGPTK